MTKSNRSKKGQVESRTKKTLFDKLDSWLQKNTTWWVVGVVMMGLVVGILTFDVKPSTGGDDTGYILQAMDICAKGNLPIGFRTPGYPLVLALFVCIFGVDLVLLKATSLICFLGVIVSLFFVFRKRLPMMIIFPLLLVVAVNPLLLEYSHHTYSELLFTLLILWAIHFTLSASEKGSIHFTILSAVFTMMSFYVRIAGVTIAAAVVIYLIWHRQWKHLGMFVLVCFLLYMPLKIYEWTSGAVAFGGTGGYFLKNYYNPTLGTETLGGFVERFINNIINHLNYQFPSALALPMPPEYSGADGRLVPSASSFFGILFSGVLMVGFIAPMIVKPKSALAFLGTFVIVYVSFISLALQNQISTIRMLVPIIPYLFLGTLEGFRWIGNRWVKVIDPEAITTRAKTLSLLAIFGLIFAGLMATKHTIKNNISILKANLAGNRFAGFTEDWTNYLKASLWIKEYLPMQTTRVICRKPELFLLYAGNYPVYGTYNIDQTNPDSIVVKWRGMKMTHLLYDNFQWSSTLRRYVKPVAEKYPQMFELLHQEGSQFPSYIFRLNYSAVLDSVSLRKGPAQ